MPRNLSDISALRESIGSADTTIAQRGREIQLLRREHEQALRVGAPAAELERLAAAQAAALEGQREAVRLRDQMRGRLGGLVGTGVGVHLQTHESAIAQLERALPVALLPVRIETRFVGNLLHVRIYPDQIHLHQHDPEITAPEAQAVRHYWQRLWSAAPAAEAWQELLVDAAPERAAYLVDRLQPTNLAARGVDAQPLFPEIETIGQRVPVQAQARLLPSRWLVTLLASDGQRMLRKWAPNAVPDRLGVSPFGNLLAETPELSEGETPLDDGMRWMVDFQRAIDVGMALTIEESELERGSFAGGIARLIVVGVDWSRTPQEASARLAEQLCAHGYSDGLAFLEPGHVTNNTAALDAGFSAQGARRGADFPVEPPLMAAADSAASGIAQALGIGQGTLLARFPGGDVRYEATAKNAQTALYGASFGFFFTEVMYPVIRRASFASIRTHVQRYLRPAGPCAPVRIGRQPYGVLPVLATPVSSRSLQRFDALPAGFNRQIAKTLASVRLWVEGVIADERVLDKLVTMAAPPPGVNPEDLLADILKQSPLATSAKVRPVGGATSVFVTEASLERQEREHVNLVKSILGSIGVPVNLGLYRDDEDNWRPPLIFELFSPKKPRYSLGDLPWVAQDLASTIAIPAAVAKVRERIAAAAGDAPNTKRFLSVAAGDADTLFEALLLLSASFEYWRAAEQYVRRPEFATRFDGPMLTELVGVGVSLPARAATDPLRVETPRQLLQLDAHRDGAAQPVSILAELHARVLDGLALPEINEAREFHAAIEALLTRPAREVDHALRGIMDAGSHRLDAWITSLATRRLQELRAAHPQGVHIGGYGFVHDLRPDVTPDSEGYVHVPSADHAVMAAVLRAAHMANRDDKPESFAVRLDSERVRKALYVSDGMAQGQRPGALLGYRFERSLIEGRQQAHFINAFRKLAPHANDVASAAGPQEAIAARDVVDGMKLAELWREKQGALFEQLGTLTDPPQAIGAADRAALAVELGKLMDLFDAFGDLWTAESVYQLARGNADRAAAALAVLDRQERPTEVQSVQTPRKCWGYAQRLLWALPALSRAQGWPEDLVGATEPGANAVAAQLMGESERFQLAAHAVNADGSVLHDVVLAPLGVAEMGLSPLALAMLSLPGGGEQPSRLEQHIAVAFSRRASLPVGAGLALDPTAPSGAAAGTVGLAELLALANAVRLAIFDRRALDARDFHPPTGPATEGIAAEAVVARAQSVEEALSACEQALTAALPPPGQSSTLPPSELPMAPVLEALERASALVPVSPWALMVRPEPGGSAGVIAELVEEALTVRATLSRLLQQWRDAAPSANAANAESEAHAANALELATTRIRLVFGAGFPVLAPFAVEAPLLAQWRSSLADQGALYRSRSKLAAVQWLRSVSLVRPGARALNAALDAAAWSGNAVVGLASGSVVQLPHVAGRTWAALPFEGDPPQDVRLSAVLFGELPKDDGAMVGLLIEEWTEAVPEARTTTSVAFQYDAPGSRAPQTICLAVDAGIDAGGWTTDALVDTVNELFDLAKLRLIKPAQVRGAGSMLPTMFIPQNLSKEQPSLDLLGLAANRTSMLEGLLGKD